MPKKMSDEEYYRSLPKKQVGSAVLLFNAVGELLMVKPDYKDSWLVPGGSADDNESPLECALRETREEIGISLANLELVGVYFSPTKGLYPDSLKFIFNGGALTDTQISSLVLEAGEIEEHRFMKPDEAIKFLSSSLRACVPMSLDAIERHSVAYMEASSSGEGMKSLDQGKE
jgi:8-oxo-dGTP diphosphatase